MPESLPSPLLFVVNPISGGRAKDELQDAIREYYKNALQRVELYILKGKNDAANVKKCIEQLKPQVVAAVGGDGTVAMVAKIILGTEVALAIIPAGSANGMAKELQVPLDIKGALDLIQQNIIKKCDLISINNGICIHLSDIGLNARLIKYFEEGNTRGTWGYVRVALKTILRRQHIAVTIRYQNQQIRRNAFMVVLANATKYGTGAVINPRGSLYDGLFEVVIIKQLSFFTFLKLWLRPGSLDPQKVEVLQAEAVLLETRRRADFQVDGEYKGKVRRVDAKILGGMLNIILPQQST